MNNFSNIEGNIIAVNKTRHYFIALISSKQTQMLFSRKYLLKFVFQLTRFVMWVIVIFISLISSSEIDKPISVESRASILTRNVITGRFFTITCVGCRKCFKICVLLTQPTTDVTNSRSNQFAIKVKSNFQNTNINIEKKFIMDFTRLK